MKPIAQMTREKLWSLDKTQILYFCQKYNVALRIEPDGTSFDEYDALCRLDRLRLELQQSAAESRLEELTVDEERQIKYDYAKASAKINPQD